jgi:hypothetical protein
VGRSQKGTRAFVVQWPRRLILASFFVHICASAEAMGGIFAKLERQLLASMPFSFLMRTHGVLDLHINTHVRARGCQSGL